MDYPSLSACLRDRPALLTHGPVMVVMDEDGVALAETVAHHVTLGFGAVVVLTRSDAAFEGPVLTVSHGPEDGTLPEAVTALAGALPQGTWMGYCYNSEFLFFPFCETRRVGEMLAFHSEERRASMAGMVIDLYARDLDRHSNGVDLVAPLFDGQGYYGMNREDPENGYAPLPRQLNLYGGLRWRFEEHIPWKKRRIDRISLFRCRRGLSLGADYTLSDPELNEIECAWHRNLTCATVSFRTAKALRSRPGARAAIESFEWGQSERFAWTGQELMERGFIEPGQWF